MAESNIVEKNTSRLLKYDFSNEEKQDLGAQIARSIVEREEKEAEIKKVKKQMDADLFKIESFIKSNSTRINNGFEMREIDCVITLDYDDALYSLARTDTGEIIEERAMTEEERELPLPLETAQETEEQEGEIGEQMEETAGDEVEVEGEENTETEK